MTPRSWLFVPGDAPQKIEKAARSGADALILDLEDSVALTRKPEARRTTVAALKQRAGTLQYWVRINPFGGAFANGDLAAISASAPDGIVLPKSESGNDVLALAEVLTQIETRAGWTIGTIKILPIATETPAAIFNLGTYNTGNPRLAGLTWGAEDLPAAVGAIDGRHLDGSLSDLCRLARSLCLVGAANAHVPAIETVYPDFRDLEGLRAYAAQGRRDGFTGMMAIHPAQVPTINEAMTPSAAEIAHARQVIESFAADPDTGVIALNGKMLDMPHLRQAKRIIDSIRGETRVLSER